MCLINSGNIPISKADFSDGPIQFKLSEQHNKNIFRYLSGESYIPILEIIKVKDAGQQKSVLNILDNNKNGVFTYLPSLLNPGDEVELNVLVPNKSFIDLEVLGKIENGSVIVEKLEKETNTNFETNKVSKQLLSIFENKTWGITLTYLVYLILGFFNILLWTKNKNIKFGSEPNFIKILALLGFSVFSIFILILFIALIV